MVYIDILAELEKVHSTFAVNHTDSPYQWVIPMGHRKMEMEVTGEIKSGVVVSKGYSHEKYINKSLKKKWIQRLSFSARRVNPLRLYIASNEAEEFVIII